MLNFIDILYGAPYGTIFPTQDWKFVEDEGGAHLYLELPGMTKDNLEIEVEKGVLKIEGKVETPVEKTVSRSFKVPDTFNSSKISATMKHGILDISLPLKTTSKMVKVKVS